MFQFGEYPLACPVAAMLQGISIFVSTLSITAIALDRRQLIVHPHRSAVGIRAMLALVPLVWAISIAMASPMAIWKKLEYWTEMPNMGILDDSDSGSVTRLILSTFIQTRGSSVISQCSQSWEDHEICDLISRSKIMAR